MGMGSQLWEVELGGRAGGPAHSYYVCTVYRHAAPHTANPPTRC